MFARVFPLIAGVNGSQCKAVDSQKCVPPERGGLAVELKPLFVSVFVFPLYAGVSGA